MFEHDVVSGVAVPEVVHGGVDLIECEGLGAWLDAVAICEVQHLRDLGGATSGRARDHDAPTLAPLITREIHYRLSRAEHGAALRRFVHRNGQAARISAAIAVIRGDLSAPLSIPDLARRANVSPSTFHQPFTAIAETTPLRYQKQLRLLEARRLLAGGDRAVSDAAHAVGYRSANQFSREYARTFGTAPRDTPRVAAPSR